MNKCMYSYRFQSTLKAHSQQSGATLIIVLILLILITLFGMASVRNSLLQERMVSGTISNNLGFQAAEAGLRQAEAKVAASTAPPVMPEVGCNDGFCARWKPVAAYTAFDDIPLFADPLFWKETKTTGAREKPASGTAVKSGKFEVIPKYIIEDFGKGESGISNATDKAVALPQPPPPPPNLYRITAYAESPGTGAETILQSIYVR